MIALLCALAICLSSDGPVELPQPPPWLRAAPSVADVRWKFTVKFYGREIIVDGWESERECRDMKRRMERNFPDALITDCEISE
jgi:hypothetical protein